MTQIDPKWPNLTQVDPSLHNFAQVYTSWLKFKQVDPKLSKFTQFYWIQNHSESILHQDLIWSLDCIGTASRPHQDRIQAASRPHPDNIQTASRPHPDRIQIPSDQFSQNNITAWAPQANFCTTFGAWLSPILYHFRLSSVPKTFCVLCGINCFAGVVLPPSQMVLFYLILSSMPSMSIFGKRMTEPEEVTVMINFTSIIVSMFWSWSWSNCPPYSLV